MKKLKKITKNKVFKKTTKKSERNTESMVLYLEIVAFGFLNFYMFLYIITIRKDIIDLIVYTSFLISGVLGFIVYYIILELQRRCFFTLRKYKRQIQKDKQLSG